MPPTMLIEPDFDIIFDPRVELELPCLAKGDPTPIYSWTKNGRLYNPNAENNEVIRASDSGSLTLMKPEILDQGYYQCNATNTWGKSENLKEYSNIYLGNILLNFRYSSIA